MTSGGGRDRPEEQQGPHLGTSLTALLGARTAAKLRDKLDLVTAGDLLRCYPRKYEQRGRMTDLRNLVVDERATVQAEVVSIDQRKLGSGDSRSGPRRGGARGGPRHLTRMTITDGTTTITCSFFNQPFWASRLPPGSVALFSGKVTRFRNALQMTSPAVMLLPGEAAVPVAGLPAPGTAAGDLDRDLETVESFAGGIIPVYPLVEGITQPVLQRSVRVVLDAVRIVDPVPEVLLATRGLTDLPAALRHIHRPADGDHLEQARRRLRYDEALAVQLVLAQRRARAREYPAEPCPVVPDGLLAEFDADLPFQLTRGQRAVGETIARDLATIHPMNRLLQGEVGSGKTVVALRAMLQVLDAGRQAVLLAPTEVLAAQHARSLRNTLGPLGRGGELGAPPRATKITLLTGSQSTAVRRAALLDIASGQAGIVVGTHALLSEGVVFNQLGLVVVDEQHRFGVEQRDRLRTRHPDGNPPHLLVMTATPIPRTVAMTVYGDLETSVLDELPAGRSPISSTVVPVAEKPGWLERVWARVREEVAAGHQVFVVCPRIGETESADRPGGAAVRSRGRSAADRDEDGADEPDDDGPDEQERRPPLAVVDIAPMLADGPLVGLRLGVLHGRMPAADKDAVMRAFAAGDVDVLVSTTVIEVGVDVPNATAMVILDAERFGMSQLHQLRGRVGRGAAAGVCLLVTEAPDGSSGRRRLAAVAASADGFQLAEADLQLRREGNVLGTAQAGRWTALRQLSLIRDREIIEQARVDATEVLGADGTGLDHAPGLAAMASEVIAAEQQEYLEKG
ncbi:ATP-dependent DNA helicase RecG [Nakamurella leprariae]|uniref:Probable DNA 3'-5' helicase RecG n=1 Tax=Nakamurella leprariae TaxID=2803911 RepID=A0A939C3Z0_9ACTN|nr:ATP-dependent DNA helicase RecG [Nakamurella leprariae]MBM9469557.1 ATP-dependent DNA helicase RecG [Nakamurella leprariae]